MGTSTREFLSGIFRRLYWLLPLLLLDPFDLAERLTGVNYDVPQWVAWCLAGVGFFMAALLTYHDLRTKQPKSSQGEMPNELRPLNIDTGEFAAIRRRVYQDYFRRHHRSPTEQHLEDETTRIYMQRHYPQFQITPRVEDDDSNDLAKDTTES